MRGAQVGLVFAARCHNFYYGSTYRRVAALHHNYYYVFSYRRVPQQSLQYGRSECVHPPATPEIEVPSAIAVIGFPSWSRWIRAARSF